MSMLKPLIRLALRRPELMSEHAQAYAGLVQAEAEEAARQMQTRWAWFAVCVAAVVIAAILAGVSSMLWVLAKESAPHLSDHVVFWLAPAIPAVVAVMAGWIASRTEVRTDFPLTREQLALDARWLGKGEEA